MAKNTQPIVKRCKALDISPAFMGYSGKTKMDTIRNPKGQMRRKQSEYALQLKEKQKVKFVYGVLEKQFRMYYEKAVKAPGITGENLLSILETRLDNVAYRMGWAKTRKEARQLVNHAHFTVNGKKVNIPSYRVKVGDVIALREKSRGYEKFKDMVEVVTGATYPKWLEKDVANFSAKVIAMPDRADIDLPVEEHLIVELYSK